MKINLVSIAAIAVAAICGAQGLGTTGIEPKAGTWHTWVIPDVKTLRVPPPPSADASLQEAKDLELVVKASDAEDLEEVRFWNAGSPAYRWIQIAQQEVAQHNLGGPAGTRAMALVAAGLNDAMVAVWDSKYAYNRQRPSQIDSALTPAVPVPNSPSYPSEHAAAAGVAAAVLSYLFPDRAMTFTTDADNVWESRLYAGTEFPSDLEAGIVLGKSVGDAVIAYARTDGSDAAFTGSFPPTPGRWSSPTPVFPLGGTWRPWALTSGSQVRLGPPPVFGSPEMIAQINTLRTLARTVETNRTAWVWQAGTIDPWIDTTNRFLFEAKLDEDPPKAAQIYALAMIAHHDATIACWDTKYTYLEARPVQADPQITTLFPTPNHPSFPSGHACASAATAGVLSAIFPDSADYFVARALEAGTSTFYAGVHFGTDVDQGLNLGKAVADVVLQKAALEANNAQ